MVHAADGTSCARSAVPPNFWAPTLADEGWWADQGEGDVDPASRWLLRVADGIDAAAGRLPASAGLRRRDCLTAAIYVDAARHSLLVASSSLRMTAIRPADPANGEDVDPRLAEWLH